MWGDTYKLGIGEIANHYPFCGGDLVYEFNNLTYYNMHLGSCGTPVGIENVSQESIPIQLLPNPATKELTIKAPHDITTVSISNMVGQIVYSNYYHNEQVQVDIADLPKGMYLIKINGTEVRKFVKQ